MEDAKVNGKWWVTLYEGDKIKEERHGTNVITTVGKSFLAAFLGSAAAAASTFTMRYVGVGSVATGEAIGDTALGTELARVSGTVLAVTGGIYRVTATFASGSGTGAIVEYGLFSTITTAGGTMFSRDTEAVVNKGANDTLVVITEVTVS